MAIKVLLADDHQLVREGLKLVLDKDAQVVVVGEASSGGAAIDECAKARPDVVIMDINMPGMNGILATREIVKSLPRTRVLILSMSTDESDVARALRAGASGYLLKDSAIDELVSAIHSVTEGETYLSPKVATVVVDQLLTGGRTAAAVDVLSVREQEVLQRVAEGMTTAEIAGDLDISPKTVENHRASIMRKLDIHDIPSLVKFAIRAGLTDV